MGSCTPSNLCNTRQRLREGSVKQGASGSKRTKSSSQSGKKTVQQTEAIRGVAEIQRQSTPSKANKTVETAAKRIVKGGSAANALRSAGKGGRTQAFAVGTRHKPTPHEPIPPLDPRPLPKESKD
jgi:hypothetical protein